MLHSKKLLAGLVGEGIQGSSSPMIHEGEAQSLGLNLTYCLIDFDRPKRSHNFLESVLMVAESLSFSGLNITHPFKEDAVQLVNTLSREAKIIGSINTIIFRDGKRLGDNTDWFGFKGNFRASLPNVFLERVALIGTGGAGMAVAYALLTLGTKELRLFDFRKQKAEALAQHVTKHFPLSKILVSDDAATALSAVDGFVNATPVGMLGIPGMPVNATLIKPEMWVADIVYFPLETELLKEARRKGCKVLNGSGMAVRQAAASFRQFFDVEPNVERMLANFKSAQISR